MGVEDASPPIGMQNVFDIVNVWVQEAQIYENKAWCILHHLPLRENNFLSNIFLKIKTEQSCPTTTFSL